LEKRTPMIRRVVLVGLSGTGKSSVGREVATRLEWDLIDTDREIEHRTGQSIPDIFHRDGEPAFRELEHSVLRDALLRERSVIATGGGAVVDPGIWSIELLGSPETLVIWLDADPVTLVGRLRAQSTEEGAAADRPLLADGDPVTRITSMRANRIDSYSRSDLALDVSGQTVLAIAADVAELVRFGRCEEVQFNLNVDTAQSTIHVGLGSRFRAGTLIQTRWPMAKRIWVVVDANLEPHVQTEIESLRTSTAIPVVVAPVAAGESSKSMEGLEQLYDRMLAGGVERDDVVIAMGGGMVGDLAGFAAATVLRGISLVQMPSTLLSMVDSSVGGKTGINHSTGKNLIGAFYQPSEVVIDPVLLRSLPERERRSGWAEIIKHAIIEASTPGGAPPMLWGVLERNVTALGNIENPITPWVIRRNVSLKASVVEADEREAGIRSILNFGHTIGHGIEAAGYALLHGEAVAVGMCAGLFIARELDLIDGTFESRIVSLIEAFGLPVRADVDPHLVHQKMARDKKKLAGKQGWVLPVRSGGVTISTDVPAELVHRAVLSVTSEE